MILEEQDTCNFVARYSLYAVGYLVGVRRAYNHWIVIKVTQRYVKCWDSVKTIRNIEGIAKLLRIIEAEMN